MLQDESEYLQFGWETERSFYTYNLPTPQPSAWGTFPTKEEPNARYKFASVEIGFNLDQTVWTRQTYSILDYMGDLGGLFEALRYLCTFFIAPISVFSLNSTLMAHFFRFK